MPNAKISTHDDAVLATGYAILLNVDGNVRDLLMAGLQGEVVFEEMPNAESMLDMLRQRRDAVDAIIIGERITEPVRIAQRVHSESQNIALLILTEACHHKQIKQVLKISPFISKDVMPCSLDDLAQLPDIVLEAIRRVRKQYASGTNSKTAVCAKPSNDFEELQQVRYYLDCLFDYAPIGVLNLNIKGIVLGLNQCATEMLDLTEREILGRSLVNLFPPSERKILRRLITQHETSSNSTSSVIFNISEMVGSARYVEVVVPSVTNDLEHLIVKVILQDVTSKVLADKSRDKAEEALRASEKLYRELVQTMSEALVLTDQQYRITYVNTSFCRMLGYSSSEVIGKKLLDYAHEHNRDRIFQCMANPMPDESVQRYEVDWLTKEGNNIHTLVSPKQIFDTHNNYIGCLGIFTDISERKKIEQRERAHMMELAHVSRVTTLGEMSSQIAHELAQPLTVIAALSTGCRKILQSGALDHEEIIKSLQDIGKQAERAREIVVRLRDFVRNEETQHTHIALNELISTVVYLVELEARWYSLPINLELQESLPAIVGDRILIEQAVLNLVHNAIESMQQAPKRELTIRTAISSKDGLQVDVIDTGSGISDADLKQVFEPFFTTKPDGMGMGLAITHSIIQSHGGRLFATHNKQEGMTFSFTLPTNNTNEGP